jgi:hypothetical protein
MPAMGRSTAPAFFILSSGRSGSTLLASMLNMHPAIHVPVELFGLYSSVPRLLAWYGDLRREFNRGLLAADLARVGQLAELGAGLDRDEFSRRLAAAGTGLEAVIGSLYASLLAASGKRILGDKTPNHSPHLPLIERLFPQAQILHLVRDGRDCAASSARSREGINRRNVAELGRLWPRNNLAIARFGERAPARYHRVRYEDLIADPARELAAICAFVGESFEPRMLDFAGGEFARTNAARLGHHANLTRELISTNTENSRSGLSPAELGIYESRAAAGLRHFGYTPASLSSVPVAELLALRLDAETAWRRARRATHTARVEGLQRLALLAKRVRHACGPGTVRAVSASGRASPPK